MNRQMLQTLIDNVAMKYPAAITGVIPDKIKLPLLQGVLSGIVMRKKSIRNLLKIIEIVEEELERSGNTEQLIEIVLTRLNLYK